MFTENFQKQHQNIHTFQVLMNLYKSSSTSYHFVIVSVILSVKCMEEGIPNLDAFALLTLILAINQVQFAKSSDLLRVHLLYMHNA